MSRNVLFTSFVIPDGARLAAAFEDLCSFIQWQVERAPTTGRLHVQGFAQFKSRVRIGTIRRALGDPGVHIEARRGSVDDCIKYCSKEDTRVRGPYSLGEARQQGKRTDLEAFEVAVKRGDGDKLLWEDHFSCMCRFYSAPRRYRLDTVEQRNWQPSIYVFYGPTGTGKSRAAFELAQQAPSFFTWARGSAWADGYSSQHTIIFDEFDGSFFSYRQLLAMLDRYPLQWQVKGATVPILARQYIITSSLSAISWYPNVGDISELKRRLNEFGHVYYCDQDFWTEEKFT